MGCKQYLTNVRTRLAGRTDASNIRVRLGCAGEVEERNERLVADLVDRELEGVARVRDALQVGKDGRERRPDRDCRKHQVQSALGLRVEEMDALLPMPSGDPSVKTPFSWKLAKP